MWAFCFLHVALLVTCAINNIQANDPSLEGMQLIQVTSSSNSEMELLQDNLKKLRVLYSQVGNDQIDFCLSGKRLSQVKGLLEANQITYEIMNQNDDVDKKASVKNNNRGRGKRENSPESTTKIHGHDFGKYLHYKENVLPTEHDGFDLYDNCLQIVEFMKEIKKNYGELVNMITIGKTYEKREMYVLHISKPGGSEKPAIFIDAGIHGREWIAPATALYVIDQLLQPTNCELLNNVDFYILPLFNPDGYQHALSNDSNWRKSRSPTKNPKCPGVDLNRNFNVGWHRKLWYQPCKETFGGYKAFSEPETRNFRDFFLGIKDSVKVYLTLHSFGQYLLYPWSYTNHSVKNEETLHCLAIRAAVAVNKTYSSAQNRRYTFGRSSKMMYVAEGTSADWAMKKGGVDLSYTIELPSFHGQYHPSAAYIPDAGREMLEILKVFIHHLETTDSTPLPKSHTSPRGVPLKIKKNRVRLFW